MAFDAALLAIAFGIVALAYDEARSSTSQTHFLVFWAGYLLGLLTVFAVTVARRHTSNRARSLWALVLSVFTFWPKFLMSLNGPVYYDEYNHYRHVQDILRTSDLGATSSSGSIIQYYPGLHLATAGVHLATRLPVWASGQIVLFAAHTGVVYLVWALARAIGLSGRHAALAMIIYCLNPSFTYFDTQFSYESLAVVFALLTALCVINSRSAHGSAGALGWAAGGLASALACTITHHISSFFMIGICVLVALLFPAPERGHISSRARRLALAGPWAVTAVGGTVLYLWVTQIAKGTGDYLNPHLGSAFSQVKQLILGGGSSGGSSTTVTGSNSDSAEPIQHSLFAGSLAPGFEKLCAYAAPVIVAIVMLLALWWARKNWRTDRRAVRLRLPFIALAAAYLCSLPVALTVAGGESAHRSWAFSYVGVALIAPLAVAPLQVLVSRFTTRMTVRRAIATGVAMASVAVVTVGNIAAGENVLYRFPGPYQFGTDTRSRTAELTTLAHWMNENFDAGRGVISDRFTSEAITGFTDLRTVGRFQGGIFRIYQHGPSISTYERQLITAGGFEYFVLDTRIEHEDPQASYFPGYIGREFSVNNKALAALNSSRQFAVVHRTTHYIVYKIKI